MPFFNYVCKSCEHRYDELAKPNEPVPCPKCAVENTPELPSGAEQITLETKDAYRGVKVRKGNEQALRQRMIEHRNKHELAEMIDKHGLDEAKRRGWLEKIKKI